MAEPNEPNEPTHPTQIRLDDLGRMRAIANPMRMQILGVLRMGGPATVGMLAERVGEAAGSVSYHVQTLAKHGFVEEVPELARDRRERWWRSAHDYTSWNNADFRDDPAGRAGLEAFRRQVLDAYHRDLVAALEAEDATDPEWVEASESSDGGAHLTLDEMRELTADMAAVREKWFKRGGPDPRPGTRLVRYVTHVYLRGEQ